VKERKQRKVQEGETQNKWCPGPENKRRLKQEGSPHPDDISHHKGRQEYGTREKGKNTEKQAMR
jgi:hypothetical protein